MIVGRAAPIDVSRILPLALKSGRAPNVTEALLNPYTVEIAAAMMYAMSTPSGPQIHVSAGHNGT
jgi:hypothetical protein